MKELSLRELLDTDFISDDNGSMIGIFTLERINMISDIITNLQQENERLENNNQDMQEEMARTWEKENNYKSRIEKVVKILQEQDRLYGILHNNWHECYILHVIDILNGRSDE